MISPIVNEGMIDEANVANLFIKMGYFARPHIQIFPQETTQQVSDIDVLAIKYDQHLNRHVVLIEVKKGTNKIADLFKLYGFKSFFRNPETYFISEKIPENFLDIAKTLEIKTISFKMLRHITRKEQRSIGEDFSEKDIASTDQFLRTIRDQFDRDVYWRFQYLWLERNPYTRFFNIQKLFQKTNSYSEDSLEVLWFRKELFLQAFVAHLDIASDCVGIEQDKIDQFIEDKFYDIGTSKEGKMKIKQGVDSLIEIIKKFTEGSGEKIELPPIDVVPKYLKNLIFLVKRTINNAPYVNSYLMLDDLIYRSNLHGKQTSIDIVSKVKLQTDELKNTNDLILRILHDGPVKPDFNNFV